MQKGENIFKRKDGRWEARYSKGRNDDEWKDYNFGEWCDSWLRLNQDRLKESSRAKYSGFIQNHIKPVLGKWSLSHITTERIGEFRYYLINEKKLSEKTAKDILVVIHSIWEYIRVKYAYDPPQLTIIYPRISPKEVRVLRREEQNSFMIYLENNMDLCKFGVWLALMTGLRIGEICALKWKDISLENQSLSVCATVQRIKNFDETQEGRTTVKVGTPKSSCSIRTIPLTARVAGLCRKFYADSSASFVITGTTQFMEPRQLQRKLKRYAEACSLLDVHFHTLRHTFATRCIELGFDVKTLSEILGHANTTITMNRYVHPSMDLKRENMKKLDVLCEF